jgi:tRNA-splicing ligase RtcB (3'-phosphate/5'-hydroxy nucleic acid ligase)
MGTYSYVLAGTPEAYKDVNEVVEVVATENTGKKVAKLKPIGVIKG